MVNIVSYLKRNDISLKGFYLKPQLLKQITDKIDDNTISSKQAKEIFNECLEKNIEPKILISNNIQLSDIVELEKLIANILLNNQKQIEDYKNGKTNLFDYFVGQVMKETKGKANPVITKEILKDKLNS